jgi:hypothetical protein
VYRYHGVVNGRRLLIVVVATLVVLLVAFGGYEIFHRETNPSINADTYLACKKFGEGSHSKVLTTRRLRSVVALGLKSNNVGVKNAAKELSRATKHDGTSEMAVGVVQFDQACEKVGSRP